MQIWAMSLMTVLTLSLSTWLILLSERTRLHNEALKEELKLGPDRGLNKQ